MTWSEHEQIAKRFAEACTRCGLRFNAEESQDAGRTLGWVRDDFGNEMQALVGGAGQETDIRLVDFIALCQPEVEIRQVGLFCEACWANGVCWRVVTPSRADGSDGERGPHVLLGHYFPTKFLSQQTLWISFNLLAVTEFGVRRHLGLRHEDELLAMARKMSALMCRGDGPASERAQEAPSAKCAVTAKTAHFSVVSVLGGHSAQFLCSRLPAHREFCWPLPGDSGLPDDLGKFADGLDAFVPLASGGMPRTAMGERPVGLQMSRIIGSWAAGWRFDRLQLQGGMLPDDASHEPSFSLYQVDTDSESHWFLGNSTFLNSLWMLTRETLDELKGLLKAWRSAGR